MKLNPKVTWGGLFGSASALFAVALLPKCPLCWFAMLGYAGLGAGFTAALGPWLGWVRAAVIMVIVLSVTRWGMRRFV